VRVNLCGAHIAVPQQFLHRADVVSILQQMRRKAVTKGVTGGRFENAAGAVRQPLSCLRFNSIGLGAASSSKSRDALWMDLPRSGASTSQRQRLVHGTFARSAAADSAAPWWRHRRLVPLRYGSIQASRATGTRGPAARRVMVA
jgi:hypothetical protein